jgi:MFS family permease
MSKRLDGRYLIVASAFVTQGVMVGSMFAYGVFFKELEADLGWSRTVLSAAFSTSFLVMGAAGIMAGRISDRIGPRKVLSAAGLLFGAGYALMFFMSSPWHLFVFYGLFIGAGLSAHDVVTLSTVARWFDKRRGMMTGVVKIGTGCGQMIIPLIVVALIAQFGWRMALAVLGCSAAILLLLAAQGMRRNPPVSENVAARSTAGPSPESGLSLAQATRTKQFWTLCGVQCAFISSLVTMPVHIPVHGMDLGMSATQAAGLLTAIGLFSIVGRAGVGSALDRIGGRRAMMICLLTLIIGMSVLLFAGSAAGLYLFAAIYGIAHGGLFTVVSPTLAEYFGTVAHGAIFGTVLFFGTLGGALGPVLAGMAFDQTGSYRLVFGGLVVLACVGLMLIATLKPISQPTETTN